MQINAMHLYKLLIENNIPIIGCAYRVNDTDNNRVDYTSEATKEQRALGDLIAANFGRASLKVGGTTITVATDPSDTDIMFYAYNGQGILQLRKTVTAVASVADYEIILKPGVYVVAVCGTISYMSGVIEVQVTD